ncbi:hypothetical protein [Mucilaginibacter sp. L196]|uniref:hypothetical protein n=1 Tax=Mucilaginibacter sp. L196 TaxID=1641870 RepID=UPI00131D0ED7|nr:hypothetical protein [Mucilaginibacter sp. L196]
MISTTFYMFLLAAVLIVPLIGPKKKTNKKFAERDAKTRSEYGVSEYGDICLLDDEKKF